MDLRAHALILTIILINKTCATCYKIYTTRNLLKHKIKWYNFCEI
jgi:hypothetical protein